jgi:hypothetical protein
MKNAYPSLPVVPYQKTELQPSLVAGFLNKLQPSEATIAQRHATFAIFLNESGLGRKGVNNNYFGFQADGSQLPEPVRHFVKATCTQNENMTGNPRIFCVFDTWQDCITVALYMFIHRGLYIGGKAHPYSKNLEVTDIPTLATAYWNEWVVGENTGASKQFKKDFTALYKLGMKRIK